MRARSKALSHQIGHSRSGLDRLQCQLIRGRDSTNFTQHVSLHPRNPSLTGFCLKLYDTHGFFQSREGLLIGFGFRVSRFGLGFVVIKRATNPQLETRNPKRIQISQPGLYSRVRSLFASSIFVILKFFLSQSMRWPVRREMAARQVASARSSTLRKLPPD